MAGRVFMVGWLSISLAVAVLIWFISISLHIKLEVNKSQAVGMVLVCVAGQSVWKKSWRGDWIEAVLMRFIGKKERRSGKQSAGNKRNSLALWIIGCVCRTIRCRRLVWRMKLGLGDASQTAIAVGIMQSVQAAFCTLVRMDTKKEHRYVICTPDFGEMTASGELHCIIMVRLGNLLKEIASEYIKRKWRES